MLWLRQRWGLIAEPGRHRRRHVALELDSDVRRQVLAVAADATLSDVERVGLGAVARREDSQSAGAVARSRAGLFEAAHVVERRLLDGALEDMRVMRDS